MQRDSVLSNASVALPPEEEVPSEGSTAYNREVAFAMNESIYTPSTDGAAVYVTAFLDGLASSSRPWRTQWRQALVEGRAAPVEGSRGADVSRHERSLQPA